ncbi:MAG: hypothetical protein HKN85_10470 [Gammaproteobacteria bacterium]|nr:hypothetical protein [Gammaproteobacteria bacterium]
MKYFGEKSLSSVLSTLFNFAWYAILIVSVIAVICGFIFIIVTTVNDPTAMGMDMEGEDWESFHGLPAVVKMLFLIYFGVLATLVLKIIKKSQLLFANFKQDIVFDQSNVTNTSNIGKLMVWFAVLTLDLGTLFVSLLLLMLCELFKSGAMLQEEHDLTV